MHSLVINLALPILINLVLIIWRVATLEEAYGGISINDFALNFLQDFTLFLVVPILLMVDVYNHFSCHGGFDGPQVWGTRVLAKIIYGILFLAFLAQIFH